ncbi:MAG: lysophospholipid acyltransferase family protein [Rhodobacteraceae bacterium]|nr:lysophospholipid acyltransferase family protein [Paracoccaceae bacterium]
MALIQSRGKRLADWVTDRLIRGALWLLLRLPFDARRRVAAALLAHVVAPLAGWRARIRDNLALVRPDLPEADRARLEREVPRSIGRTLAELYSGPDFVARVASEPLQGPGVPALEQAFRTRRPVLLVTGHLGNYDAIRGGLIARGYPVGGLYRPMDNAFFNEHYVAAISRIGTPLFPRGRKGLAEMIRFLKGGGMVGVVLDQSMGDGAVLSFFGQPALTSLSPAEMALRYDALVLPTYGLRRPDGGFDLWIEAPIPHTTAEAMTQALNDSLEAQVRAHMDQWLWTHRRWKMSNRIF